MALKDIAETPWNRKNENKKKVNKKPFGSEARACSANQYIIWGNGIRQMGTAMSVKIQQIRVI